MTFLKEARDITVGVLRELPWALKWFGAIVGGLWMAGALVGVFVLGIQMMAGC